MLRFALAGNPNSGKTTLFNSLTGSTAHVGNWPGVTVDKKQGTYKKLKENIAIIDLPGIYSLSPYTPEEVIARNYILDEKPDCVINIVDATNLERNLYLTTQIMEIDVPVVIALNMIDAVKKAGDSIDSDFLEKKLGVPVVQISALKNSGLDTLMERAYEACSEKRKGTTVLEDTALKHLIGDIKIGLEATGVNNPMFHAVKLAELDELEVSMHQDLVGMVDAFKHTFTDDTFGDDFEALVADGRYKYITKHFSPALKRSREDKFVVTSSDKADKVLTHKIWGIPIFLLILFTIFHLTFSENLLFLGGALPEGWVSLEGTAFEGVFGDGAIYSPGVILLNLVELGGTAISNVIAGWLGGAPEWVSGLIVDGVLGGVFAVLSFLPQILLLFLFFTILEDSGYMARIAFILDKLLRKFGLSGRAFLPMIMGFGCSVPAIINTRTLADEKERISTIRVIPFFSCMAKLPILTAVSGAIFSYFGVGSADLITYGMYVLGITVAIIAVIFMRSTTLKGEAPPFIMELPSYRAPQFKNLMIHLWNKAKHFIEKAFTIILASTIVIWVVSHFSFDWRFLPDEQMSDSILAGFGKLLVPIFTPLGFGSQLNLDYGWVFVVAAFTGLIAKENVIATLGTLAASVVGSGVAGEDGVMAITTLIHATGIGIPGLIAFIAFNMTTIPCFAAVGAAKGELIEKGRFKMTLLFWIVTSYLTSTVIYVVGSLWWTSFIFLALLVGAFILIRIWNKKSKKVLK